MLIAILLRIMLISFINQTTNKKSDDEKLFLFLPFYYFVCRCCYQYFAVNHHISEEMDTNKTPHFRRKASRSYYTPEGKENFDPNFLLSTPKRTPDAIDSPSVREFDEEILSKTRTVQKKNKKKKSKHKFISNTSPAAGVSPSDVMSLIHLVSEVNIM